MAKSVLAIAEVVDTGNNLQSTDLGNPLGVLNLVIRLCKPCFVLLY